MAVIKVNLDNFAEEVLRSEKPVLLDMYADWCGPCQMIAPVIEELSNEVLDAKICKIDVDEYPQLASKYGVMSIPTLVVVKNGQVTNQSVGVKSKAEILGMIK